MSYFGKRYTAPAAFDPNSIVSINTSTVMTAASVNKQYILNSPANYSVTLPSTATISIGDQIILVHGYSSGTVTLNAFSGQFIQLFGVSTASMSINTGDILILEYTGTTWLLLNSNRFYTAAQGTNDTTPATAAFVQNEHNKHRNAIINANFDFWQRSTAGTIGAGENKYFADRWLTACVGSSTVSSRQAFTVGQTAVPGEPTYYHRAVVTSVAGASNYSFLTQRIESVRTYAGKTVTLSFWAKADATKNMAVEFIQYFGTGGSPSSTVTALGVTTAALTTAWTKYTVTTTLPSISGKSLGSNDDHFLGLQFWYEAGSTLNARTNTLGNQSGTFEIAQVQLEEGSVASQFEMRNKQIELALCQRFYERIGGSSSEIAFGGALAAVTSYEFVVPWKVTKRAVPTLTLAGTWSVSVSSQPSAISPTIYGFKISATVSGTGGFICRTIDATTYVEGDSEL